VARPGIADAGNDIRLPLPEAKSALAIRRGERVVAAIVRAADAPAERLGRQLVGDSVEKLDVAAELDFLSLGIHSAPRRAQAKQTECE